MFSVIYTIACWRSANTFNEIETLVESIHDIVARIESQHPESDVGQKIRIPIDLIQSVMKCFQRLDSIISMWVNKKGVTRNTSARNFCFTTELYTNFSCRMSSNRSNSLKMTNWRWHCTAVHPYRVEQQWNSIIAVTASHFKIHIVRVWQAWVTRKRTLLRRNKLI